MQPLVRTLVASVALAAAMAAQASADPELDSDVLAIARRWDIVRYTMSEDRDQFAALAPLAAEAAGLMQAHPLDPAPLTWRAIISASQADTAEGLDGLSYASAAKHLLEQAMAMHPDHQTTCLIDTTLGELYALAPGFPLSFGDRAKAWRYLTLGVQCDPTGAEANLYFGEFALERGRRDQGLDALSRVLRAPPRPQRDVGDAGVRAEALEQLQQAHAPR
jgi:hypothetical protein